ncbi:hypothetical protein HYFRA_00004495 [Hymenoscyphus fraxineus]|uniref:MYND-type domain-containing protein n=1 Tax=Hymenoscyphus fraxineus TaxID=746836 RepID=A0A9N9PTJ2_9HELO|nr:hypothetical protein HYFRA_00004495 [Hymenoscyphus fraxineus]
MAAPNKDAIEHEAIVQATPWNTPTTGPGRLCSNATDLCNKPATSLCARCKFDKYCSRACQKRFWTTHKHHCKAWPEEPVHEIVSYDPKDTNYFKADPAMPKSLDRPNIFIDIKNLDGKEGCFDSLDYRLRHQYAVYSMRRSMFGTSRYPKTIIMVEHENLASSLLEIIEEETFQVFTAWDNIKDWFRVVHEETPRRTGLQSWKPGLKSTLQFVF